MSHDEKRRSWSASVPLLFFIFVLGYIALFIVVWIDEVIFRTFIFSKVFGDWGRDLFRLIYFPIFKLLQPLPPLPLFRR